MSVEIPVAWRVRARDKKRGMVHQIQVFQVAVQLDAEQVARRHARRLEELYQQCKIEVEPLCFHEWLS